jgi:hypothetical protein
MVIQVVIMGESARAHVKQHCAVKYLNNNGLCTPYIIQVSVTPGPTNGQGLTYTG